MALTAAIATALAAVCAAGALGMPAPIVALALLPALALVAAKPDRRVLRAGLDVRILGWAAAVGALLIYLLHPPPDDFARFGRLAVVAIVPLSLLWPAPAVVRSCLVLAAGSLAMAGGPLAEHALPAAGLAAGAAVALVSLNRLSTSAAGAARRRRTAAEAAALFVIAGLIGVLAATLLPPPSGGGGGGPQSAGRRPGRPQPGDDVPPYLLPVDELDAGGPGTGKGDEVVFRVRAPSSALWRTMTFDSYDGRTWSRSEDVALEPGEEFRSVRNRFVFVPPGIGDEVGDAGRQLKQHVTIETDYVGVLPGAARAETVELRGGVAAARDGTLLAVPPLGKGATYTLTSALPPTDEADLRPHDARSAGVRRDVGGLYLAFPGVPTRVTTLAADITAAAPTEYDRVRAIQDWVRTNTDVKAGTAPVPAGADPIDQYLFVDRAGSSQQAATAAAIMLRSLGIPARLAVGYLPGDRAFLGGEFVVRARHAHAWVEAWFPDVGWVGFDPAGRLLGPTPAGESLLDRLRRFWWVLLVVALVAAAWAAWRLVAWRRRQRARPWATRAYERLTRAGGRHGRPRQPAETPVEYCTALAGDVPDPRLVEVGALVTAAAWSGREPPAEARSWADEVVLATRRSAPRRHRRRARHRPADALAGAVAEGPADAHGGRLPPG